jgi:hypothetical protein
MAQKALEVALEGLGRGRPTWGDFGTNTRESEDRIIVDRGENARRSGRVKPQEIIRDLEGAA